MRLSGSLAHQLGKRVSSIGIQPTIFKWTFTLANTFNFSRLEVGVCSSYVFSEVKMGRFRSNNFVVPTGSFFLSENPPGSVASFLVLRFGIDFTTDIFWTAFLSCLARWFWTIDGFELFDWTSSQPMMNWIFNPNRHALNTPQECKKKYLIPILTYQFSNYLRLLDLYIAVSLT